GAVRIDDAANLKLPLRGLHSFSLTCDDADRMAADSGESADQRLTVVRLVLVERTSVNDSLQEVASIVLASRDRIEEIKQRLRRHLRRRGSIPLGNAVSRTPFKGKIVDQLAQVRQA